MAERVTGSCLCGGVRYEVDGPLAPGGHCHCSICRKFSGAGYCTDVTALRSAVRFTGAALLRVYRFEDRKDLVFCSRCGSSVLGTPDWTHPAPDTPVWLCAGTLDGDPGVRPQWRIWVGSKAPWDEITDDIPQYQTEPEAWATE